MPINETGHAKNVGNFGDLISFVTSYGTDYNPSKAIIKLPSLNNILNLGYTNLENVVTANTKFNNEIDARALLFDPIKTLSTRLINALMATDANSEKIKDAKAINRKVQGQRAKAIPVSTYPNTPAPETISVSQLSYVQMVEHFRALVEILKSEPSYAPNESELKVTSLTALLASLKTANKAVSDAHTEISNARIARNKVLYKEKSGLCDVAAEVKAYVKSVFGATSPEFKQINKISFKTRKV